MQYHLEPKAKDVKNGQTYCLKAQDELILDIDKVRTIFFELRRVNFIKMNSIPGVWCTIW